MLWCLWRFYYYCFQKFCFIFLSVAHTRARTHTLVTRSYNLHWMCSFSVIHERECSVFFTIFSSFIVNDQISVSIHRKICISYWLTNTFTGLCVSFRFILFVVVAAFVLSHSLPFIYLFFAHLICYSPSLHSFN